LDNAANFLLLAALAERFLGAPPTSVASEQLFSSAAKILAYMDRCNPLLPKRANC